MDDISTIVSYVKPAPPANGASAEPAAAAALPSKL